MYIIESYMGIDPAKLNTAHGEVARICKSTVVNEKSGNSALFTSLYRLKVIV